MNLFINYKLKIFEIRTFLIIKSLFEKYKLIVSQNKLAEMLMDKKSSGLLYILTENMLPIIQPSTFKICIR